MTGEPNNQKLSRELGEALAELGRQVGHADNPVGAARAVRRAAARHRLEFDGQQSAFMLRAEELLVPYFTERKTAKAVAWLACDAGWDKAPPVADPVTL